MELPPKHGDSCHGPGFLCTLATLMVVVSVWKSNVFKRLYPSLSLAKCVEDKVCAPLSIEDKLMHPLPRRTESSKAQRAGGRALSIISSILVVSFESQQSAADK
eukprot:5053215-Pleurochrysis_carterae.AAC.1